MQKFEKDYAKLVAKILTQGVTKETRNGKTISIFGESLVINDLHNYFPLLQGRKMYPNGIFGELAAMLRKPKHIEDFEKFGCNYWKKWAKPDGSISVDYGNAWFDFEGYDQIAALKESLANNPNDRRMIINSWRPHKLKDLDLPCCHYSYQFYVANGYIDMIWTQRSVDTMVGLPSDIAYAAAWLIAIANEFNLIPGKIKLDLGDCHIYEEHIEGAELYLNRVSTNSVGTAPGYLYGPKTGTDFCTFKPEDIFLSEYESLPPIKFELKE